MSLAVHLMEGLGYLLPACHQLSICDGRLELRDELPRNRVVLDVHVANGDSQRIGIRAEGHISEREDDLVVGVTELRVVGVMNPVKLRCDRKAVHECGNFAADVRMSHKAGDGHCHELPDNQCSGGTKHEQRELDDHFTAKGVEEVMAPTLQ